MNDTSEKNKNDDKNLARFVFRYLTLLLFVVIIILFFYSPQDVPEQKKISSVLFVEKVFSSNTCNEFISFFDGEAKKIVADDIGLDDIEECDKERKENIEEFSNLSCNEIDKKDLNLDYIDLGVDMPIFSDVVYCIDTEEDNEGIFFFLNYNGSKKTYKIVNGGGNIEKEVKLRRKEEEIRNKEIEARKNTTNPAYLISPELFVIDERNIISDLPDDDKSVWVEEVIDENTIRVSYIILKGGENIITFATVSLYGIGKTQSECFKGEAIKFLKKFIEHKYIYLSGGYNYFPKKTYPKVPEKFLLKYVRIWKQDVNVSIISKLHSSITDNENEIEVNAAIVYLGYGMPTRYYPSFLLTRLAGENECYYLDSAESIKLRGSLENMEEFAKVAKRGFWADNVCNEN